MPCVCLGLSLPCDLSSLTDGRGAVDLQAPLPHNSLFLVRMGVTTSKFSMVRLETGSPHLFYILRVFFFFFFLGGGTFLHENKDSSAGI